MKVLILSYGLISIIHAETLLDKKTDLHIHVVTDHLKEEQVKKVMPSAKLMDKRKIASDSSLRHPDFIQGLVDHADLRTETKDWDQLEFDMLYMRANEYGLFKFLDYYQKNKPELSQSKLRNFWMRNDEVR